MKSKPPFTLWPPLLLFGTLLFWAGCGTPVTVDRFDDSQTLRDTTPPQFTQGPFHDVPISRIKQSGVGNTFAVVFHWTTDIRAKGSVFLSNNQNFLDTGTNNADSVEDSYYNLSHDVIVSEIDNDPLIGSSTYFYYVESEDPAGNIARSAVIPLTIK